MLGLGLSVWSGRRVSGGSPGEPGETSMASSVTYDGVTFTFSAPVPVGSFVTGEPFVVSDAPFSITAVSPASANINADGHIGHGMMENPYCVTTQGFDAYLGLETGGEFIATGVDYVPALNVDPAINGAISVAAGAAKTFVKSVRLSSVTGGNAWQTVEKYVPLHVLPSVPFADAYPPAQSATTKTMWRRSQINASSMRSVTMPGSFSVTAAAALAKVPSHLGIWGQNGNARRRTRLDAALGTSAAQYSGQIADDYAQLMLLLHSAATSASDRDAIIDTVIKQGIHIHGLVQRGWLDEAAYGVGAGQSGGVNPWVYGAAFLLNDASLLASARALNTNMTACGVWVTPEMVGGAAPGKSGVSSQTFLPEMVGQPLLMPDEIGSNHDTRYGAIGAYISGWEHLPVLLFQNGPGGVSGLSAILNGPNDNTNQRAASVAHLAKYRSWSPFVMNSYGKEAVWDDLFDTVATATSLTPYAGPPEQLPYGQTAPYDDDFFTAGDGAVSWNVSAFDYATETITAHDLRYSLDGVQWVEVAGVAGSGTQTGLLKGAAHWLGLRRVSASGAGPWSANYPYALPITSGSDRSRRTTVGTAAAAAPVITVNPVIMRRVYPAWGYLSWVPAESSLSAGDFVEGASLLLSCGVGYCTGHPAPTYTYQWRRNGVNISGATSKTYTATRFADGGAAITCQITMTNASGSAVYTAAATSVPVEIEPPAPTVFERIAHTGGARITRSAGMLSAVDGKAGTFAWRGRLTSGDGTFRDLFTAGTTNRQIQANIGTTNVFAISMRDAANVVRLNLPSTGIAVGTGVGEITILASWDVGAGLGHLYINGVSRLGAPNLTDAVLKFATTQSIGVLAESDGAPAATGETDFLYFGQEYVDLTNSANRAIFSDPAALGAWGRGPTGNRPLVFAWGDAASWNGGLANKGAGGPFVATGTFTDV